MIIQGRFSEIRKSVSDHDHAFRSIVVLNSRVKAEIPGSEDRLPVLNPGSTAPEC